MPRKSVTLEQKCQPRRGCRTGRLKRTGGRKVRLERERQKGGLSKGLKQIQILIGKNTGDEEQSKHCPPQRTACSGGTNLPGGGQLFVSKSRCPGSAQKQNSCLPMLPGPSAPTSPSASSLLWGLILILIPEASSSLEYLCPRTCPCCCPPGRFKVSEYTNVSALCQTHPVYQSNSNQPLYGYK